MHLVDTHQHLWDLGCFPYTWTANIPALHRSFRYSDYVAAAKDTGIEKTVFMEHRGAGAEYLDPGHRRQRTARAGRLSHAS